MIRRMEPGEEKHACDLVKNVFFEFVAPLYERQGVEEFLRYVDPRLMAARSAESHFVLLAEESGVLLGVMEVRDFEHISLLFVDETAQRRGIARQLLHEGLRVSLRERPSLRVVSVHSSPNAVKAYERLGFRPEGPEQLEHGIRYIPMSLLLANDGDGP